MEAWKEGIYQKTPRIDLTFWYGGKNSRGKKFEMTEEEKKTNNKIMKEPVITEEEMLKIVNRQRNGKRCRCGWHQSRGNDTPDKKREHLLKSFNKCVDEKVQEDWLNSKTTMIPKTKKKQGS